MKKEPAAAFMQSSNDSLHADTNGHSQDNHHISTHSPTSAFESAILSPESAPQPQSYFEIAAPKNQNMASSSQALPERQSVESASQLPSVQNPPLKASDSAWFDLYYRLVDSHAVERSIWQAERDQLLAERQKLLEQLGVLPKASPTNGIPAGKENDKIFYNPATVKHATESLRKFSQSSRSEHGSMDEGDTSSPKRRVSIAPNPKVVLGSPSLHPIPEDDPYSPQTTAAVLSPVPYNFVMDAGSTPMKKLSPPATNLPDSVRPVVFNHVFGANHEIDEDKELSSPKMLPSQPSGDYLSGLDTLNQKLQAVAENPDEHPPDALVAAQRQEENANIESDNISPTQLPKEFNFYNGVSRPVGPPNAIHDADVGVKLKKKRSSNFGAPFGKLS